MGALSLSYKAPLPTTPYLTAWIEVLSGDDDPTDDAVRVFDTLYATNHGFYGYIDFFTNIPIHTGGHGLVDAGGRLGADPVDGLSVWLDWHHFEYAREHPSGATTLGNEIDLLVRYQPNRYLAVEAVLAAFFPRLGMSVLHGGEASTELYGYLQTDVKF